MRKAVQRHNSLNTNPSRVSFVPGRASDGLDSKTCHGGAKSWATIRKFLPLRRSKLDSRLSSACPRRSLRTARSEERRVGKECSSRRPPETEEKRRVSGSVQSTPYEPA